MLKRILLIEDDESQAAQIQTLLQATHWQVTHATSCSAAQRYISNTEFDVILVDIYLPDGSGVELIPVLLQQRPSAIVIAMTSQSSTDLAVEAMRHGAYDFLEKPLTPERLTVSVENALHHKHLRAFQHTYQRDSFHDILGASLPMQAVFRIIESAAPSDATVFITGESGTGKELCAQALHAQSPRRDGPFVALNCAAIPRDLMESEIFGHVKGAFTGANTDRKGAAARANGGTLFLDEICEMDLALQSKLLRFFQSHSFLPVGGQQELTTDVRVVCATNRNPLAEVKQGRFREDLYYRLHVIPLQLPPLRERGHDVLLIADQLLQNFNQQEKKDFRGFSERARQALLHYHWPGNIRELENVIRNIIVLHAGPMIDDDMLPEAIRTQQQTLPAQALARREPGRQRSTIKPLWQVEQEAIEDAIRTCDGNINQAAELLQINPSTIYRKRKKFAE